MLNPSASARRALPAFILGVVSLSAVACTTTSPGQAMQDLATPPADDLAEPPPPDFATPNGDAGVSTYDSKLIGFWGIKAKAVTTQNIPIIGMNKLTNTLLGVAEFKKNGMNQLVMEQQGCSLTVVQTKGYVTTVPDKIAETTPLNSGNVSVFMQGASVLVNRADGAAAAGCKLTVPLTEALPTMPTDARVFDQDGDGKPGVTIQIQGTPAGDGFVYVAQRQKYSYQGTLVSDTKMTGTYLDRSEQTILDTTNASFRFPPAQTHVDAESVYEMVKLTAKYDCVKLRAEAPTLFTLK